MKVLGRFFASNDKGLIIAAFCAVLIAWFLIRVLGFRYIVQRLGNLGAESALDLPEEQAQFALNVGKITEKIAQRLNLPQPCFPTALAAIWLTSRCQIPTTLYLGAYKQETQLFAHAWLRCGKVIITGQAGHQAFTVLATFAIANVQASDSA